MDIINMTPHPIHIYGENHRDDGPERTYDPSGQVARVVTIELGSQRLEGDHVPSIIYDLVEYGRLEGLPMPEPGKMFIVSLVCALAARGRSDLLAPYIEVRNTEGTMIGCRYLQKIC